LSKPTVHSTSQWTYYLVLKMPVLHVQYKCYQVVSMHY